MQKKDPTEDVMAAIARIVDTPNSRVAAEDNAGVTPSAGTQALATIVADENASIAADGYSRLGPGPLPALRFKWTARRQAADEFYVDETIGDHSRPITTGPMSADEAIALVDTRVKEARERFDRLKADISVRNPSAGSTE